MSRKSPARDPNGIARWIPGIRELTAIGLMNRSAGLAIQRGDLTSARNILDVADGFHQRLAHLLTGSGGIQQRIQPDDAVPRPKSEAKPEMFRMERSHRWRILGLDDDPAQAGHLHLHSGDRFHPRPTEKPQCDEGHVTPFGRQSPARPAVGARPRSLVPGSGGPCRNCPVKAESEAPADAENSNEKSPERVRAFSVSIREAPVSRRSSRLPSSPRHG